MPSKKDSVVEVEIPQIDVRFANIKIIGDSPLIMHRWDEKVKKKMLDEMMGKAKTTAKIAKNPVREFIHSMYWLSGFPEEETMEGFEKAIKSGKAKFGFPATGFKAGACIAGYRAKIMKDSVVAKGNIHVVGEFVEINGIPRMREDMVRVANGSPDIRYRGEFPEWDAVLTIRYNAGLFTIEQIVNLFNLGGFMCGVGENRPDKKAGGSFGMYHVAGHKK